ncbi:hypothetical protein [Anaeromyxobacter terrae]|uniref:hypothetical protein n=1 Tax=Anaeromyxobacter terrae TaxID=2925406 RepID=UPI001F58720D|nr:hypothetical protein [Anaeromyxobacter sp. SG22]
MSAAALVAALCALGATSARAGPVEHRAELPGAAPTAPQPEGAARAYDLRVSLKASGLVERNPDDPLLFPDRNTGSGFWRLRLDGSVRPSAWATILGAWEQRLRVDSGGTGAEAGLALLPRNVAPSWRLRPLDASIAQGDGLSWRHELDRAAVQLQDPRGTLTVGRQAVGWGRGVVFGAVDLFNPFTPLEVDREWRRGIDAVRGEARLGDTSSFEALWVGAERAGDMAAAGRLRMGRGEVDGELVGGWRAGDAFGGAVLSAAAGDAELHAEAAAFRARDPLPAGGVLGSDRLALKGVAGASNHFTVWKGITVVAEYHYATFGARRARDLGRLALDPAFRERLLRGDTQIPGRHALAVVATSELSEVVTGTLTALLAPDDGSGVVAPQLKLDLGDKVTVLASLYLPFGAAPSGLELRSFYGTSALTGFVQVAVYE